MKLLLDQNLSWRLITSIEAHFPGSQHVRDIGLSRASDREVWEYARENGYTVCSKDNDFNRFAYFLGAPPKIVWLRVGNLGTQEIHRVILEHVQAIHSFEANEEAILIIEGLPE